MSWWLAFPVPFIMITAWSFLVCVLGQAAATTSSDCLPQSSVDLFCSPPRQPWLTHNMCAFIFHNMLSSFHLIKLLYCLIVHTKKTRSSVHLLRGVVGRWRMSTSRTPVKSHGMMRRELLLSEFRGYSGPDVRGCRRICLEQIRGAILFAVFA